MDRYDPYFAPTPLHEKSYDFITCTEVVEHFRAPLIELKKMCSMVQEGGWIGIMTQLRDSHRNDPTWWYLRDRTHVSFYSAKTFEWIARALDLKIHSLDQSVIVMRRA